MNTTYNLTSSSGQIDEVINNTKEFELPLDMRFNEGHVLSIATYSVLLVVSATGNLTVLSLLLQRRKKTHSRINTMLLHLAIADLLVTFLLMPLEIAWAATVSWKGGDALCRIMAFFRTFGLFLSSFILVCISLDRYFAIMRPMSLTGVDRRGKVMLSVAWATSVACSLPQMAIFHVERHPGFTWYEQCVTFNSFASESHEIAYAVFGMFMMYGLPLAVIIFSYASILAEIFRRSRDLINDEDRIRRSSLGFLGRAKIRTLKMTIIIVFVFFVCWTPYYVMCVWYWCDKTSAMKVDQRVQKALFLFACTNSCMNPIVYGAFNIRVRRAVQVSRTVPPADTCSSEVHTWRPSWSQGRGRAVPDEVAGCREQCTSRPGTSSQAGRGGGSLWRRPQTAAGSSLRGARQVRHVRWGGSTPHDPWDHLTPCPSATRL